MREKIAALVKQVRMNRFDRSLMRYFDWPLFLNVLLIALFGVVCIFSATTTSVTEKRPPSWRCWKRSPWNTRACSWCG